MTTVPTFDPAQFPPALLDFPQWVAWRAEDRKGRLTKVPICARTGRMALTNSPSTWVAFEEVLPYARANGLGVGYVFGELDPFAGVDLDRCIDAATRTVAPWAWAIVVALDSYTEVSPSGLGVKIIVRATLPPGRRSWGDGHGMYDRGRFFTLTGTRFPGFPAGIAERQGQIAALHAQLFPPALANGEKSAPTPLHRLDDADVIHKAAAATNGAKFMRLWLGDRAGYDSGSEADAALLSLLAFWVGADEERLDALFRQSGLMREKWERASYRRLTLALALKRAVFYDPRRHRPADAATGRVRLRSAGAAR